jgi:hypothetical protein
MSEPLFLPDHTQWSAFVAYLGMTCILCAFVFETRGRLNSRGWVYLWLMIIGSGLLGIRAAHLREWAFLILEAVWCLAAIWALCRPLQRNVQE